MKTPSQISIYDGAPVIYIADPGEPAHHGPRVLRIALDEATEAYWDVIPTRGHGHGHLRARMRSSTDATVVVQSRDTLISESEDVRAEWAERLRAAGWRVVLDGRG